MSRNEDGSQSIFVKSTADSHIYLDSEKIGETFAASKIDSPAKDPNKRYKIRIEKDGFEPKEIEVEKEIHSLFGWNLIFLVGAPIGFAVDYFNGSYLHYNRWITVELDKKSNFKRNPDSETNLKFITKRDADKNLPVEVRFEKISHATYEKTDENGNPVSNSTNGILTPGGTYSNMATLDHGYYKVTGFFLQKDIHFTYNSSVTRIAKKPGTKVLKIPGGGVGIVCGTFDPINKISSFQWIHIPEFISRELAEPKDSQLFYLSKHCDQIYDINNYLKKS
ncbi:LEPBI_I2678 family protein [Leptospira perdikensis]|uniref:PEGA domain-containing protein n=1 Tax=Leptospira perdikensis TaxID=2484948 RepID=A0A4V3JPN4_9LEPT|nr:hypothetical protein [Leptospira perdikensis]TGL45199.1 hypothetical protein EHQ49_07025 [Leptospira perdikensis]